MAGSISANALRPYSISESCIYYMGAGSGGTIYLAGATVTGESTATLAARGGDTVVNNASGHVSPCGGGGRISIWGGADLQAQGTASPISRHSTTPAFDANKGQIVWNAATDVTGGTNILKRTDISQYESTHGGAGTVYFNMALPRRGLAVYVQ